MNLFAGLYLYELVLLALGTIFFIVLILILGYLVLQRRSIKALPVFFIFPVVMIGYPSIKSFQYRDGVITIEKTTAALQSNPTDQTLRQQLAQNVEKLGERPIASPRDLAVIGEAQYTLGNEEAAKRSIQQALRLDPSSEAARSLQHQIEVVNNLNRLSSAVEANPVDTNSRRELKKTVAEASQLPITNPEALTTVAKAQNTVGEQQKALATVDKALKMNPNLTNAMRVRSSIQTRAAVPPSQ